VLNSFAYDFISSADILFTIRIDNLERFYELQCSGRTMGGFMTWDEIQVWLDDLHAVYPNITSASTSIGNTIEGRPQLVMKIGTDNIFTNDDPTRPNCWYDGLIHAREGASMQNICSFMEWLCANYDRNGYCGLVANYVLENRDCWFLPCNNVDGWVYNESTSPGGGGMWRKNRRANVGGTYGVDLNRNWAVAWGGAGSSGTPGSET
jgi:murein tripeptide amidase MpaA